MNCEPGIADWFCGPLTEVWGVPSFWIARLALLIQFLSALVIVVEIIGKERIEQVSGEIQSSLTKLTTVQIPVEHMRRMWDVVSNFLLFSYFAFRRIGYVYYYVAFALSKRLDEDKYLEETLQHKDAVWDNVHANQLARSIFLPHVVLPVFVFSTGSYAYFERLSLTEALTVLAVGLGVASAAGLMTAFLGIPLLYLSAIYLVFYPAKWLTDHIARLIIKYLEKRSLSKTVFGISLVLLVFSFIIQMVVA